MSYIVRTYVSIKTDGGEFERLSPSHVVENLDIAGGVLTYPDNRVSGFRIYVSGDSGSTWYYKQWKAFASKRGNFSYAVVGELTDNEPSSTPFAILQSSVYRLEVDETFQSVAAPTSIVEKNDADPNRMLVSEVDMPLQFFGRNANYIGDSATDAIFTFGVNAAPISQGQFGEYPLFVFCKNSRWALQVGQEGIAFSRITPISIGEGIVGPDAKVNVGNLLVFCSKSGIQVMPSDSTASISAAIQNSNFEDDILPYLDDETALGYFQSSDSGRRELWVATSNGIYCYSFELGRWFMLDGVRSSFSYFNGRLIGNKEGVIVDEEGETLRSGTIETAPIHLGEPDILKKFRRVLAQRSNGRLVLAVNQTEYSITIRMDNIVSDLYYIDVEFEPRYSHRANVQIT